MSSYVVFIYFVYARCQATALMLLNYCFPFRYDELDALLGLLFYRFISLQ